MLTIHRYNIIGQHSSSVLGGGPNIRTLWQRPLPKDVEMAMKRFNQIVSMRYLHTHNWSGFHESCDANAATSVRGCPRNLSGRFSTKLEQYLGSSFPIDLRDLPRPPGGRGFDRYDFGITRASLWTLLRHAGVDSVKNI